MRLRFSRKNIYGHTAVVAANVTVTVNCTNPKIEIQVEIIKTQTIGIQIYFLIKKIFLLFSGKLFCSQLNDLLVNSRLLRPL